MLVYCFSFIISFFFFFNDTATTEIYTLSLHDALPIYSRARSRRGRHRSITPMARSASTSQPGCAARSEEHTSELQSRPHLVCRLLLEKKKKTPKIMKLSSANLVVEALRNFFFNDTATTEIYTLSLHDALPISLHNPVVL